MILALLLLAAPDTYTAEELRALDRALHAANLTRDDLAFEKAHTKGHGCLAAVRALLAEPLKIAPEMDRLAARVTTPLDALAEGAALLGEAEIEGAGGAMPVPATPEEALALLERIAAAQPATGGGPREQLLDEMTWHMPTDLPKGELHETAAKLPLLAKEWLHAFGDPARIAAWPASAFPADAPLVRDTPFGRIALGTPKDDVHEGDYSILVDPAGDDRYRGRVGAAAGTDDRRVGLLVDLHGDDVYDCATTDITLGAAVLGIAALYDLGQGNDRYSGGHVSMGAAIGGTAVFFDDGGSDVYEGKTFTEGAAAFGIAVFFDDATQPKPEITTDEGTKEPITIALFDNDRLSAHANAQAFARPRGVAFCVNRRGNDTYEAGGVYLHAPLFADRYQSFAQGFSIGSRDADWAGGLAMLIDFEGNDRYLGDVYNQGVGYWYGAGLLWDGAGNDSYEMTQYGQGSGIHLAVGGLVDVSGNDTYVMHSGLGQGSSHDYAASVLHDRGGNDRYMGATSCNGSALTNSVGLFLDRAGDDTYGARREGGLNTGRPARGFGSIGVMLDLGGKDDYLGPMEDGGVSRGTDVGVWADVTAKAEAPEPGGSPAPPPIRLPEGPLSQETFDQLWEIAVRWEVGDNRVHVPRARKRIVELGPDVLPYLDGKIEEDRHGLELRAFVEVLRGLPATALLRRNLAAPSERRRKVALHVVGELKLMELEGEVAGLLADPELDRRAAAVLAAIGSHAGDETLVKWLAGDSRHAAAAASALLLLEADAYEALRQLLGSTDFAVRGRLVAGLAAHFERYGDAVRAELAEADGRALRSVLDVLARAEWAPSEADAAALSKLLGHEDWGARGDAARVIARFRDLPAMRPAAEALGRRLAIETEPYVKAAARP